MFGGGGRRCGSVPDGGKPGAVHGWGSMDRTPVPAPVHRADTRISLRIKRSNVCYDTSVAHIPLRARARHIFHRQTKRLSAAGQGDSRQQAERILPDRAKRRHPRTGCRRFRVFRGSIQGGGPLRESAQFPYESPELVYRWRAGDGRRPGGGSAAVAGPRSRGRPAGLQPRDRDP